MKENICPFCKKEIEDTPYPHFHIIDGKVIHPIRAWKIKKGE